MKFAICSFVCIVSSLLGLALCSILPEVKNAAQPRGLVDGAGYSMHNTGFSLDLAMQANPPVAGEQLGIVTLEPYRNGRDQKWGTSFYGTNEVALSNGQIGSNFVSVYYPEGSSRDKARLYSFEELTSPNTYKIKNLETQLCLRAVQSDSNSQIKVEFGSCTEGNHTWLLRRTG